MHFSHKILLRIWAKACWQEHLKVKHCYIVASLRVIIIITLHFGDSIFTVSYNLELHCPETAKKGKKKVIWSIMIIIIIITIITQFFCFFAESISGRVRKTEDRSKWLVLSA